MFGFLFSLGSITLVSAQGADVETQINMVQPVHQSRLKPVYIVDDVVTGTCSASLADPRPDAWRCYASNEVYDPCFKMDKKDLICMQSPWVTNVTKVTAANALISENKDFNALTASPWALTLVDGSECIVSTGATKMINEQRVNYSCNDGSFILGSIDQTSTTWKVNKKLNGSTVKINVGVVWY